MFFFETIAFVLVFPICWWLGGRLARAGAPPVPPPQRDEADASERSNGPSNVVDLAQWRRTHADAVQRRRKLS